VRAGRFPVRKPSYDGRSNPKVGRANVSDVEQERGQEADPHKHSVACGKVCLFVRTIDAATTPTLDAAGVTRYLSHEQYGTTWDPRGTVVRLSAHSFIQPAEPSRLLPRRTDASQTYKILGHLSRWPSRHHSRRRAFRAQYWAPCPQLTARARRRPARRPARALPTRRGAGASRAR
jgi:hypothetical protein